MKVPANATPEVTQAFRDIFHTLKHWETENVGFSGRRIIDAGDAVDPGDYVTLRQLTGSIDDLKQAIVDSFATSGDNSWSGF